MRSRPILNSPSGKAPPFVAYESSGTLAIDEVPPVCDTPGDLNGDGVVGADDLAILLNNWG